MMILSDAIPNRNGVGTYYHDLMEHLRDHIGDCGMIPAEANCIFRQKYLKIPLPGDRTQFLHFPHFVRIRKRLKDMQPQLILTPSLGPFALLTWLLTRGKKRPAMVMGYHTSFEKLASIYWKDFRGKFLFHFLKNLSSLLIRSSDLVIVNTDDMADEVSKLGATRILRMGTSLAKPFVRKETTPPSGELRSILYAGRLAPEKNLETIVDAARKRPELHFKIAGEGPLRESMEQDAKDLPNLTLLGWLNRDQLLEQVDACDMLILPSHIESFGSVALEGMARARMVLVSSECGILNWQELAPHLFVMQSGQCLADALEDAEAMPLAERKQKALAGCEATRAMNDLTISQWLETLSGFQKP